MKIYYEVIKRMYDYKRLYATFSAYEDAIKYIEDQDEGEFEIIKLYSKE